MKKEVNYLNILTNVLLGKGSRLTNAIGYIDTGNTLRCGMTGRRVAIASFAVAKALAPPGLLPVIGAYMSDPLSVCTYRDVIPAGMHLIPYNTICSDNQLLLAIDIDFMFVGDCYMEKKPLLGISPAALTIAGNGKCILLNKYYMKRGKRHVKHYQR